MDLVKEIRSRLRYEPETGKCFWIAVNKFHPDLTGKEAGCIRTFKRKPRVYIKVRTKAIPRARVAFIYMTGRIPTIVDHANGNTLDDRWTNLREVTTNQNAWNVGPHWKKKSGLPMGVRRIGKKFHARVAAYGVTYSLGAFASARAASAAYLKKKRELHGEFTGRLNHAA